MNNNATNPHKYGFSIRLDEDLHRRLKIASATLGRPMSELLNDTVERSLEHYDTTGKMPTKNESHGYK